MLPPTPLLLWWVDIGHRHMLNISDKSLDKMHYIDLSYLTLTGIKMLHANNIVLVVICEIQIWLNLKRSRHMFCDYENNPVKIFSCAFHCEATEYSVTKTLTQFVKTDKIESIKSLWYWPFVRRIHWSPLDTRHREPIMYDRIIPCKCFQKLLYQPNVIIGWNGINLPAGKSGEIIT